LAVEESWFALWTHSHCDAARARSTGGESVPPFLPLIRLVRRGGAASGPQADVSRYLFLRHTIDKASYIEIMKTNGVVRILGERWDRPAVVAGAEIDAVRQVLETGLPILPHSYLREGQRVRITEGPLAGVEGVLVRSQLQKGLLVLSVELLQRSVAVEVDCTFVVPLGGALAMATPASPRNASPLPSRR
jgi:hypothetical protein